MKLEGLEFAGINAPGALQGPAALDARPSAGAAFGRALSEAVGNVHASQVNAGSMVQSFTSGEEVDLHQVLIAVEKAELSFKTMMQVRNKLLDAYREIMRMNV